MPPTLMCPLNSHSDFHRAIPHTAVTLTVQILIVHLPDHKAKPLATTRDSVETFYHYSILPSLQGKQHAKQLN